MLFAHMRRGADDSLEPQGLADHLEQTAARCRCFADSFGAGDWGAYLGALHDLGKAQPGWQSYLREKAGDSLEASLEQDVPADRGMHSSAGAIWAESKTLGSGDPRGRILGACIAGHHAGLPDWEKDEAPGFSLQRRLWDDRTGALREEEVRPLRGLSEMDHILQRNLPKSAPLGAVSRESREKALEHFHLWVRMLFSCLVDADSLDTEAFMEPHKTDLRGCHVGLETLKERFDAFMERKQDQAPDSLINRRRKEILSACREKAKEPPGFFSLTVPTGGGKTLASMAFALEHALRHRKRRVVVAIPYTSIIEQTAKVLKYGTDEDEKIPEILVENSWLFGEDNVLEHHSNLDPTKETPRSRLAAENWDAPVVVTTNVQLFESLLASSRSSCRKLHNLTDSVLILDEAQMLPPEYLRPILSVLRGLVEHFGVTVVFCTATQPALTGRIGADQAFFQGLSAEGCTEIVEDPASLSRDLGRVRWDLRLQRRVTWEELAEELQEHRQVLCVVNTRRHCRELHALMPEGTVHLSAFMCGEERSKVIGEVKAALRRGDAVRVISTQLVEAGVDIDFPVVYRALGGVDSLAQAAGRCNREGRLPEGGLMVVFLPPAAAPTGLLRKGEDATREVLEAMPQGEFGPELYSRYFREFYRRVVDFDKPRFQDRLVRNALEWQFQFRTFARHFHLIDEQGQRSIVVWYQGCSRSSLSLIEELRRNGPSRDLARRLQRFIVNVSEKQFGHLCEAGYLENVHGYMIQKGEGLYKPGLGLLPDEADWGKEVWVI